MTTDVPTPTSAGALLRSALAHHLDHRLVEAQALYRRILDQDPNHVQALGMLALILAGGPDDVTARKSFYAT